LEGIATHTNPAPDFSEYDKLYENYIVKDIPNDIQLDIPFAGFANVEGDIFTFGSSSLARCSYSSDGVKITQWGLHIPHYVPLITGNNLQYKNDMIFLIGKHGVLYLDYHNLYTQSQNYLYWSDILDVVSLNEPVNGFVTLSEYYLERTIVGANYSAGSPPNPSLGAVSLINVNDTILALGKQLTLYCFHLLDKGQFVELDIEQVKQYPTIAGTSMLRDDDLLIVANKQGLLFYDISDLENITIIP
jgi:hypothetical protein